MKRAFTASVSNEGDWYVAQALDVDVAGARRASTT